MTQNLPALFTMSDLEKMASAICKSNLFGIKTPEQAITLMLVAQAEGMHPATAARDYHVIQGRPALKADAMLARFQQAGGVVEWQDYTDAKVSATFRHPQSPKPVLVEWTFEMARKIGLATKDNWRNYPRQMLRARVVSEGVRTCYPAIATGIYAVEEVQDFSEKDVSAGTLGSLPADRQGIITDTAVQVRKLLSEDKHLDAYSMIECSGFDADEQIAFWSLLDSKQRSMLKRMKDAERADDAGRISQAQHKRLEAKIKELGVSRGDVKDHCKTYGVEHFTELSREQYQELDAWLDAGATGKKTSGDAATGAKSEPNDYITPDQLLDIEDKLMMNKLDKAQLLAAAKVLSLARLPAADGYARACAWISRQIDQQRKVT